MFTTDVISLMESGCSLIVGTVRTTGEPWASRGWGLDVVDAATGRVRVLLGSDDRVVLEHLATTATVAVTGSDVVTLRSAQIKGRVVTVEPVSATDRARSAHHCDAFFAAVRLVDDISQELMERLVPTEMVACELIAEEVFDQTPGPSAGATLGTRRS